MPDRNRMPAGFLQTYRRRAEREVRYIRLGSGFLKLEYGLYHEEDMLARVSFVRRDSDDARAIGRRLELILHRDRRREKATFIAENAVSGLQWAHGMFFGGNTLDEDPGPVSGIEADLDDWIDECIDSMINPSV